MTSRMDIIGQNGNIAHAEDLDRELNSPTSSLTKAQQIQAAIDTGICGDGKPCTDNYYCYGCPNDPQQTALDSRNSIVNGFREEKAGHENHSEQPLDMVKRYPKYYKDVRKLSAIDVYAVHELFDINDPSGCIQHASKKLLLCGVRTGGKDVATEIKEARDTLTRKLQLMGIE